MNELYESNYHDEGPFFLSNFGQITRCVRINGVHNEQAIDRNTDAIIAQTEMQKSESDESQVQFSGHSMMLERESNETQDIMTAHTKMVKDEMDELETLISDHTSTMKAEADETQNLMTAQTKTIKDESDESQSNFVQELNSVINKLQAISEKIDANTQGDATNANGIKTAIQNLRLYVNP